MILKHNYKILPLYVDLANTFWKQLKGLMFEKTINQAMIFQLSRMQRISLHTMFMHQTIDIVFVNNGQVTDVAIMNPWRFYKTNIPCAWFVELPSGSLKRFKIRIGDDMKW